MTFTNTAWGLASMPPDTWLHDAACKPETAELFWPVGSGITREASRALTICGGCPVIEQCGQWAIDHGVANGIWGGMREDQLRALAGRCRMSAQQKWRDAVKTQRRSR